MKYLFMVFACLTSQMAFSAPLGIMGAMEEEVTSLKQAMHILETKTIGGREYIRGELFGRDTVLVFSRWGKVAAAATVATLINEYKVEGIIFTGVAGATAPHLNIGDVVIATHLYQHDMDASPLFPKREIPYLSMQFFSTDKVLFDLAKKATFSFFESRLPDVSMQSPKLHTGVIASGDQFISNVTKTQMIVEEVPETLAVEMEGAAVAQVCFEHNVPFVIIRIISDRADHQATIDFPKFVSEIARHYSMGIVKGIYQLMPVLKRTTGTAETTGTAGKGQQRP